MLQQRARAIQSQEESRLSPDLSVNGQTATKLSICGPLPRDRSFEEDAIFEYYLSLGNIINLGSYSLLMCYRELMIYMNILSISPNEYRLLLAIHIPRTIKCS